MSPFSENRSQSLGDMIKSRNQRQVATIKISNFSRALSKLKSGTQKAGAALRHFFHFAGKKSSECSASNNSTTNEVGGSEKVSKNDYNNDMPQKGALPFETLRIAETRSFDINDVVSDPLTTVERARQVVGGTNFTVPLKKIDRDESILKSSSVLDDSANNEIHDVRPARSTLTTIEDQFQASKLELSPQVAPNPVAYGRTRCMIRPVARHGMGTQQTQKDPAVSDCGPKTLTIPSFSNFETTRKAVEELLVTPSQGQKNGISASPLQSDYHRSERSGSTYRSPSQIVSTPSATPKGGTARTPVDHKTDSCTVPQVLRESFQQMVSGICPLVLVAAKLQLKHVPETPEGAVPTAAAASIIDHLQKEEIDSEPQSVQETWQDTVGGICPLSLMVGRMRLKHFNKCCGGYTCNGH